MVLQNVGDSVQLLVQVTRIQEIRFLDTVLPEIKVEVPGLSGNI